MSEKKQAWKPGNMLYPVPAVMVSVADKSGNKNIITIAWAGTICSDPAMLSISVRPERHSYSMIKETGEFVLVRALCGLGKSTPLMVLNTLEDFPEEYKACLVSKESK